MPIPFDTIPNDIQLPLFWVETRPAQEPIQNPLRLLLIGAKRGGNGEYNKPYALSQRNVTTLFGTGSMLWAMFQKARRQSPLLEIWGMAPEPGIGAIAATGRVRVKAAPSTSLHGSLIFYIAGQVVAVSVKSTDTQAGLATKIAAQINHKSNLPVIAAVDSSDNTAVNITAKWSGSSGSHILITADKYGADNPLYSSLISANAMAGSSGEHQFAPALSAIGEDQFDIIACGLAGSTAKFDALDDYYNHTDGTWSPYKQTFGHAVIGSYAQYSDLITTGDARNGPHMSIIPVWRWLSPTWEVVAAVGAQIAQHLSSPPEMSRPLQTLPLLGIEPPRIPSDWFTKAEREALLESGVSTLRINPGDRSVSIERIVTCYKTNEWGDPDVSWKSVETLLQNMYYIRSARAEITGTYPRAALTDEDTGIPDFASPGQVKDTLVHHYIFLEDQGLVEESDIFAENLIVERNALNANRLDVLARPDFVNQLNIFAMLVETHLTSQRFLDAQ